VAKYSPFIHTEDPELRLYQESFSDFLSEFKFKTFATFTTKFPMSLESSRRFANRFARHIEAGERSTFFWSAEPFDTREGFHFHGLIDSIKTNQEMKHYWSVEKDYGISSFLEIHRALGKTNQIENYITKYISKKMSDYDLYVAPKIYNLRSTGEPEKPDYITHYDYDRRTSH